MAQVIKRFSTRQPTFQEVAALAVPTARLHDLLGQVDPSVLAFLKNYPRVWLTGGAIRNILSPWEHTDVKDYDFSFLTGAIEPAEAIRWWGKEDRTELITYPKCIEIRRLASKSIFDEACTSFLPPIQLLNDRYNTIDGVLDRFDFTICQFGLGFTERGWELVSPRGIQRPWDDLAEQVLRYVKPERDGWAGTSLARSYKFSRMGYRITDWSMGELCRTVYCETAEKHKEWKAQEEHFPTIPEPGLITKDESDKKQFLVRFQRGLAHYNKGGSLA